MAPEQQDKQALTKTTAEYELRKYLLLLATLVATVTYAAGLNLPGGSWADNPPEGQLAGDSILRHTNYMRYIVFFYFNAISFAASLLAGLLLLLLREKGKGNEDLYGCKLLTIVRTVMVADLFGLMGAYAAGSSHDVFTFTIIACGAVLLASGITAYAVARLFTKSHLKTEMGEQEKKDKEEEEEEQDKKDREKEREILLVLAIFAATIAYVAGLNPPGGFWRSTVEGHHTAGDPVLHSLHRTRYRAFFFFNTTAFTASLLAIRLILVVRARELQGREIRVTKAALYVPIITALLSLGGAYTLGSCRDREHTGYVFGLLVAVAAVSILLQVVAKAEHHPWELLPCWNKIEKFRNNLDAQSLGGDSLLEKGHKTREDIQLLAILAATIAYQAAVDPPGGVWVESGEGHNYKVGDPILMTTHPIRYKIFFYFNSAAFVASLVIMVTLQWKPLAKKHVLEALMILDLFGLIGAFAAGGCRDASTSFYTVALAGAVLVYVVIHIVFCTLEKSTGTDEEESWLLKQREVLLLLAILAATLTYQAGLTPPGGCWEKDKDDGFGLHTAGSPVLLDKYPRRFMAFYYCNAAGFMASVALIVLLLNENLYWLGIRCYALYVCMVAGMLSLMGAYSAGSSFHLRPSIIVLVLAAVLAAVCFAIAIYVYKKGSCCSSSPAPGHADDYEAGRSTTKAGTNKSKIQALPTAATSDDVLGAHPRQVVAPPATGEQVMERCTTCGCDPRQHKEEEEEEEDNKPPSSPPDGEEGETRARNRKHMMYLMMVGILGASVTYITGLKPPGGVWRDDDGAGHAAGNPVLYDTSKHRYNAFFYSNSVSFMTSITIIASLLLRMILRRPNHAEVKDKKKGLVIHLGPMHAAMVVDMLGLLGAYAAGSARKWGTSTKVVLLLVPVLLFVWGVLFFNSSRDNNKRREKGHQQNQNSVQQPKELELPENGFSSFTE